MKPINLLFSLSNTYWLRYDEYIIYVQREKKNYVRVALYSTIIMVSLIIGFQLVQMDDIKELRIPYTFIIMIIMLEFQIELGLVFKMILFPFAFGFHRLIMCIFRCCACGRRCYPVYRTIS